MINLELWKQQKKKLHLTHKKIAEMTGVSLRTIDEIFRGNIKTPRIDTMEAIETALGLKDDVFYTTGETVTPDEYDLLTNYRNMTAEDKKVILYFSERLANFEQKK